MLIFIGNMQFLAYFPYFEKIKRGLWFTLLANCPLIISPLQNFLFWGLWDHLFVCMYVRPNCFIFSAIRVISKESGIRSYQNFM
jgi:hypothetical protein